jgi:hypothetical protein
MRLVQLVDSAGLQIVVNAELVRLLYAEGSNLTRVSFQPAHSVVVQGSLAEVATKLRRSDEQRSS